MLATSLLLLGIWNDADYSCIDEIRSLLQNGTTCIGYGQLTTDTGWSPNSGVQEAAFRHKKSSCNEFGICPCPKSSLKLDVHRRATRNQT